jgi:hypothetical protein
MKKILVLLLLLPMLMAHREEPLTRYSAVFLKGNLVASALGRDSFSRQISQKAKGDLTVQLLAFSEHETQVLHKLPFRIGIRNWKTGELTPFSDQTYLQIPVEEVLLRCGLNDQIELTLTDGQFYLTENRLMVVKETQFNWLQWMRLDQNAGDGC